MASIFFNLILLQFTKKGQCVSQWRSQSRYLGGAKKFGGGKMFDFRRINSILFGKTPLKAQNDHIF